MQSMDNSIQIQYDAGNISAEEAYMKASDKTRFVHQMEAEEEARRLREQGIDPATVTKKKKFW